jgi:LPS-assembly protein
MTKRGVLFENEFRYLEPTYRGTLVYDVIAKDRQFRESRDFVGVRHAYAAPNGVSGGINYNRVSDDNYFVDFSNNIVASSQKVLPQDAFLSYSQPYWSGAVRVTKNQTLQDPLDPITPPYERVPQATITGFVADWKGLEAAVMLDGTRFTSPDLESGSRYFAEPRIAYPILAPGWFVIPRARFSATSYALDPALHPDDPNPTRALPILSLESGLVFERDINWFGRGSRQTLEPKLFYAYIPFRDQSQLPNFDSALADLNYAQLFTENIYSGYDRISEANQLTLAIATRIIDDETGAERLRAAIAQRYYFSSQRVTLPGEAPRTGNATDVLAALSAQLGPHWAVDFATQYSAEQSEIVRVTAGARWQPRRASVLTAYYRYQADDINQIDISGQWPLSDRWYAVGRYNYSLQDSSVIDVLAGFEYKQDCWLLRFAFQRFATATDSRTTNFYLQLELNGLTSVGTNAASQLQRNIPGYQMLNPIPRQPGRFDYYE